MTKTTKKEDGHITPDDIRRMARAAGIKLRGQPNDIDEWRGYSYEPYRYVAIIDGVMVEGEETGNFLPQYSEALVIITRHQTAAETIAELHEQYEEYLDNQAY